MHVTAPTSAYRPTAASLPARTAVLPLSFGGLGRGGDPYPLDWKPIALGAILGWLLLGPLGAVIGGGAMYLISRR